MISLACSVHSWGNMMSSNISGDHPSNIVCSIVGGIVNNVHSISVVIGIIHDRTGMSGQFA